MRNNQNSAQCPLCGGGHTITPVPIGVTNEPCPHPKCGRPISRTCGGGLGQCRGGHISERPGICRAGWVPVNDEG